jgi:IclR family KDG regulon transcriptional repressor
MAKIDQYILQSVDNSLSIIELLCDHEELSLTQIVSMTKFGKSTVFRMLITLERHKLINKTKINTYRLGYRFAAIGAIVTARMELVQIAHGYLQDLSAKTKETTHLTMLVDDSKVQFIDKVRGDSSIWMESVVGMTREAHLTGSGKTILAFQSDERIERYIKNVNFKKMTENSIMSSGELKKELKKIRENGFGCDNEESEKGLVCFAAPVRNFKEKVFAAVSISGFRDQMNNRKDQFIKAVMKTADEISNAIS